METLDFVVGQRWVSHSDTDLGLGIVTSIEGRRVTLGFPASDEERTYARESAPLSRIRFQPGETIETFEGQRLDVMAVEEVDGVLLYHALAEGEQQVISEVRLSGHIHFSAPHQRLFAGQFERNGAFRLRLATLEHLDRLRQSPVQGLTGARTQHLPHQLYIAHEVARRHAPRVLLADEVGLGKTIEAGLIVHHQLHTGRARRVLVVVPESLVHQWLVEMLRRFNLHFSLVDEAAYQAQAIESVDDVRQLLQELQETSEKESPETETPEPASDNPFENSQCVIASLDFLTRNERAREDAEAAGWDLLVVDEAHHLAWSPESASAEYRLVESLAAGIRGLLLLTATPEQVGVASHFARLRLLDPARFHDLEAFRKEESDYAEVNRVVQQLRASGEVPDASAKQTLQGWLGDELDELLAGDEPVAAVIDALLDRHGTGRVLFRNTRAAIQGFPERQMHPAPLPCPALYPEHQRYGEQGLTPETLVDEEQWLAEDPRVAWLEKTLTGLRPHKVVVICANADTAMALEAHLQLRAGIRSAAFHEYLSLVERDRAAAYFTETGQGAQALICSEIGSEGRNFQFASHLILFDLPANPDLLEQRIGRLDRIGQGPEIDIHVPYLEGTSQAVQFAWLDQGLDAFRQSQSIGVAVQEQVRQPWQAALDGDRSVFDDLLGRTAHQAQVLREQLEQGRDALVELNSCRLSIAEPLIEQIEQEEEASHLRQYMNEAFDILGVEVEHHTDDSDILKPVEHGLAAHFPELPEEGLTVTWDRQQALEREDLTFLSWEHPMVTGVMEIMTGSELGKAALASMSVKGLPPGTLLLEAIYAMHCAAPAELELSRYLPVSPLRVLVDVNGRNLGEALPHDRLNDLCANIRRRTAQSVVPQIRAQVETMVDHAEGLAQKQLPPLLARARERVDALMQPEIRRLEALARRNPLVRESEINYFREQLESAQLAIDKAQLVPEGIRVIVTS